MSLITKANTLLKSSDVKNQVILSFFLKGLSICLSLFVIPITLSLLTTEKYGIWITLQSVFSWILLLDIGVGNGLRNKLAKSLAEYDLVSSKIYISTAYFIISLIGLLFMVIIISSVSFINWKTLFKSKVLSNSGYTKLILISLLSLTSCFILGLINQIFNAFQKNWLTNIINIIANALFLTVVIFFRIHIAGNLILLATVYCSSLIFSHLFTSILFFVLNPSFIPSVKYIRQDKINDILKLGGSFFIIQIAVLLIFSIDNFLILQLLGASTVAEYNIVYRLFSVFIISFGIIMGPLWSAFTAAYVKNDIVWIKSILRNLQLALIPITISLIIVCRFVNQILAFWLPHDKIITPDASMIVCMAIFVLISYWNNIYSYYLNGISETKIQVNTAIIGAVINVPLAIFLVKYVHLGLTGIIISMITSLSFFSFLGPIETYKTLKERSNGKNQ